jgi:serine/threonine-protein kinase
MIGRTLASRFLIQKKLGQGGMGTVYKALHTQMDRVCAIKVLSGVSDAGSAVERFKREARMASRIDNNHAVTIYDFGEAENGLLYLAMEFIDGQSLTGLMSSEWPLGIERTVRIATEIAEALEAAHSLGIVHRDLKPDNIMLTNKGGETDYVKVLDFGIAKLVADDTDNLTKTGLVVGTPVYMSPEQLSGEKLDARSDVYSLAIIVYEMLSGTLPFVGNSSQALMIQRVVADPVPLRNAAPAMSVSIEQAVMAGLSRTPEARAQTAREFADGLAQAVHGGSTRVIGSVPTGRITNADSSFGTLEMATPMAEPSGRAPATPPPAPPTTAQNPEAPTVPVSQPPGPGAGSAPNAASPSPSSFVTRPSVPQERYEPPATRVDVPQRPGNSPPAFAAPPAVVNAGVPETLPMGSSSYSGVSQPAKPRGGNTIVILAVIAVIIVLGAGTAAYFVFFRGGDGKSAASPTTPGTPSPGTNPSTTQPVGNEEAARNHYEAGRKHQQQAYLLANAGSSNEAVEESRKAVIEYTQALAVKPVFPEAHENLAVAIYNTGQVEASLVEYRTAIDQYISQLGKPTAQVMTNYGLALFDLHQYRGAAEAFTKAIGIDPTDYDLLVHRGFALQNAGDTFAARADYQKYLSLAPAGQYVEAIKQVLAGKAQPPTDSGNQVR